MQPLLRFRKKQVVSKHRMDFQGSIHQHVLTVTARDLEAGQQGTKRRGEGLPQRGDFDEEGMLSQQLAAVLVHD